MQSVVVSDAHAKLKEEVKRLQTILSGLTSERDDLKYHICPELTARYAREIGDFENRLNYQKLMVLELKRRIEIARAALNREKTVSKEKMDEQVNEEYGAFHDKVNEAYEKAQQAKREQEEREQKEQEYQQKWQEQYGGDGPAEGAGDARDTGNHNNEQNGDEASSNCGQTGHGSSEDNGEGAAREGSARADEGTNQRETGSDANEGSGANGSSEEASSKKDRVPNIKELYRKIIKKLHPDMNPNITEREKELFNMAVKAYQDGDIVTLQKIYDEVFGAQEAEAAQQEMSYNELLEFRDKLQRRIDEVNGEIRRIKQAFPYNRKEFLDDEEAVAGRRAALEDSIRQYEETIQRLTKMLEDIMQEMEELRQKNAQAGV